MHGLKVMHRESASVEQRQEELSEVWIPRGLKVTQTSVLLMFLRSAERTKAASGPGLESPCRPGTHCA